MNECRGSDEIGSDYTHLRAIVEPDAEILDRTYQAGWNDCETNLPRLEQGIGRIPLTIVSTFNDAHTEGVLVGVLVKDLDALERRALSDSELQEETPQRFNQTRRRDAMNVCRGSDEMGSDFTAERESYPWGEAFEAGWEAAVAGATLPDRETLADVIRSVTDAWPLGLTDDETDGEDLDVETVIANVLLKKYPAMRLHTGKGQCNSDPEDSTTVSTLAQPLDFHEPR